MQITFSPIRGLPGAPETAISVAGDTITVDGIDYDLSAVPEGGEGWFEGEHPFVGPVTRIDGAIRCTLRLIYDARAVPDQPSDPAHWQIVAADGAIAAPIIRAPEEESA